jgi:BirA family transcriptional regulator, biotin operon repressor / biotin---[acetyl-CoA-carboxylase] ligase
MALDPAVHGADASPHFEVFDTLESTNTEALARARAGTPGPLWIAARRQTAGRGRRGRTWVSEPGNLYATLLLTEAGPPARVAELSFAAALAVHDAVLQAVPALAGRLSLKWPNDVLLDGAKVAGILIEGETIEGAVAAAIGIGVNCAHHPGGTAYPATDLAGAVPPDGLLAILSRTMTDRIAQWDRGRGFAAIPLDWLSRAASLGEPVRVTVGAEERAGRFDGLDEAGHLLLTLVDGTTQRIAAGDVFPMATPSGRAERTEAPISVEGV